MIAVAESFFHRPKDELVHEKTMTTGKKPSNQYLNILSYIITGSDCIHFWAMKRLWNMKEYMLLN